MRVALLLLFLAPAVAFAQAGRFLLAVGEVTLVRGSQQIRAATGTAVETGDLIRVGERSSVQLRMSDQSIISLRSNTEFRIDEYSFTGRGDDTDRSVFSLLKGGMRTVGGAIARQPSGLVRTAARPAQPTGPQPTAEEKAQREESKVVGAISAPLRAVAGALTPTRHAVKVPTATIGIRGTHYTLVHCNHDCFERRRTSVASLLLAQSDTPSSGLGTAAANGTYGGISDGLVGVTNNRDDKEFGANQFFYVASADSLVQGLIGPPGFLYDRLDAQDRNRGQPSSETTANMGNSGLNAESRPSETPIPPAPPQFVVTEQRNAAGDPIVVANATPLVAPNTAFLSAFANATGGPDSVGAFVDSSALNVVNDIELGTLLSSFSVPAGSTANSATGAYSGSATGTFAVEDMTVSNALGAIWGRWFDGSATDARGTTTFSSGNVLHYLVGPSTPPEVIAAKVGTFGFDLVPNSFVATNNLGETASLSSGRLTVDFTARTVGFPSLAVNFQSQPWSFPANTAPIVVQPGRGGFVSDSVAGSCGPITSCNGTALLSRTGAFMGPAGDHLGVAFQARTLSGTPANMQGTALYRCASSPC